MTHGVFQLRVYCIFQSDIAKLGLSNLLAAGGLAGVFFFFFESFAALACAAFLPAVIKTDMLLRLTATNHW